MTAFAPLPDRAQTRHVLEPILPAIHRFIDAGVREARLYIDKAPHDYEPGLHAAIVRAHVKHYLQLEGFYLEDLPFNGICLQYLEYRLKVLKAPDDELPSSGHSRRRRDFMQQVIEFREEELRPVQWNLLILWNVDGKRDLSDVRVACTKPVDGDPDGIEEFWSFIIEEPATLVKGSHEEYHADVEINDDLNDYFSMPQQPLAGTETTE